MGRRKEKGRRKKEAGSRQRLAPSGTHRRLSVKDERVHGQVEQKHQRAEHILCFAGQAFGVEHGQQVTSDEVAVVPGFTGAGAERVLERRERANPAAKLDCHAPDRGRQVCPQDFGPFQCQQPAKDDEQHEREMTDEHGIGKGGVHNSCSHAGVDPECRVMRRPALRQGAALALGVIAVSCAPALEPHVVVLPQPDVRPVDHISDVTNYRVAMVTIAKLVAEEVGLPQFPVTFHFFPDEAAFEKKLLEVGYEPALAREAAREMLAIGGHRGVLLNEAKLFPRSWVDRVALFAHELTHSLQYELGGGRRGASDQWLREGFADWVSMRVLERLRVVPRGDIRRQRIDDFRNGGSRTVPLDQMATFPQWVALSARTDGATYLQAFLAADFLIERHGMPALIAYFSRFARSDDRLGNYRQTFGQD